MFALSKAKLLSIMTIGFRETAHYSQKAAIRFWVQHQQQLLYILAVLIGLLLVLPWGWLVLLGYAGLGILSTIGLGTGVHTRLLFLWPMIAAEGLSDRSFLSVMWRVLPRSMAHGWRVELRTTCRSRWCPAWTWTIIPCTPGRSTTARLRGMDGLWVCHLAQHVL